MWSDNPMTYFKGPGSEIGTGLAALATQFIGTQNTLQQQDDVRRQQELENQFKQQQAEEQRRQYDASSKQARDTQAFQFLQGQQSQMTSILAKGGYPKDSAEYKAAQEALRSTNQLMSRTIRGEVPSAEEMQAHDTLIGNVGAIIAGGAAAIGDRTTATEDLQIKGLGLDNDGKEGQNAMGRAQLSEFTTTSPYRVEQGRVAAKYAEPNAVTGLAAAEAGIDATKTNTELTALEVQRVQATLDSTVEAINSTNDLGVQKNTVLKGLLALDGATQRAEYLGRIAGQGETGQAILSGLVADGVIDQPTADAASKKAGRVVTVEDAQTRTVIAQADSAEIGVDTARFQLEDMKTKAPLIYDSLKLSNEGAKQLLDFNTTANPERLTQLQLDNDKTRQAIQQSDTLFPHQKDLLIAQVDLTQIQAEIAEGTKDGTIDGSNAQNWQTIALAGNTAVFDRYVKEGKMTAQQAAPWKRLAEAALAKRDAEVRSAEAGATVTESGARVAVATEDDQIRILDNQADQGEFNLESAKALFPIQLKSAQTALDSANQQLAAFKEQRPVNLNILRANLATLNQELDQNAQLFGPKLAQARATVGQLESQLRVMEKTEGAAVSTANSGATTAAAQATSAQAAATVDVATIPAMISARNIAPKAAQAALDAQLLDNKFADQTFARRVKAIDLNNSTSTQQLLALKQQYSQNKTKFPKELEFLDAQIATQSAQAQKLAAELVSADGTSVTDRKSMGDALKRMQIGNADLLRTANSNYRLTVDKLIPNAKFSVDKYDPKNFSVLIASSKDLGPDGQSELQAAAGELQTRKDLAADLITALGQNGSKGRIDPKVAERLGIGGMDGDGSGNFISGPSNPPAKAPKARNVPAGIVSGEGGVVYSGGGAQAVQSLLPQSEISKQITMTTDHYIGKIKQQGGYSNPWDNTAGPVRAYNGMGPSMDVQKRYVNDIRATYSAQPWIQAITDATGARKTELQFINAEATRIAKQRGVDPNIIKAIMWNESMGWQPGIPSSDGKGGGLGQVTGYFPPKGSTYSSTTRGGPAPVSGPTQAGGALLPRPLLARHPPQPGP